MFKKLLLLAFGLFLVTNLCLSQETAKGLTFQWDDFSKGLDTKTSSFLLPKNKAVIAENCRFNSEFGSLSKREQTLLYGTADTSEAITGMHRLYLKDGTKVLLVTHGDEIEKGNDSTGAFTNILNLSTGNYYWQWVTWNNIAIGTDGYNQPVKYDGSSTSATYLGTCLATNAAVAGTGPAPGTYSYKVTFYTTTPVGYEVAFDVASNSITTTGNDVTLSMIPIGPTTYGGETVVGRKIYRLQGATYQLLEGSGTSGAVGTITNNTTTSVTDSDETAAEGAYPTTYTCTPPKGKLPLIHYNRLFLANDPNAPSRLYYSDDSSYDYFKPTDYYMDIRPDDGDQITFIKQWLGVLTVAKDNSIQKVYTTGDTPSTDWGTSDVFTKIGCRAMYTAKVTPLGIIYLGNDGLYKFTGQYSYLISDAVTPETKDISESNISKCWGEIHKNTYYFSYASKATGSSTNNRILIFDLLTSAFSIDKINANCFTTFSSGTDWDTLYYGSSTDGKVYSYSVTGYEIFHSKHSDFTGTFTNARYIPVSVGGDTNNPIIEIARVATIDATTGIINASTGVIDRDTLTASYVSQVLDVGATTYDKIYWNERFVSSGDNITFAIRSAGTSTDLPTSAWSSEFTDPSGSDIVDANTGIDNWMQYRASLTTDNYNHSPELYRAGYVVRITYKKQGSVVETSIPLHWRGGWTDLGYPGRKKILRKIYCIHNSPEKTGTLTLKFNLLDYNQNTKNYDELSDTFNIDLTTNPNYYTDYFASSIMGELVNLEISNGISSNDLNPLDIRKIIIVFDLEPQI